MSIYGNNCLITSILLPAGIIEFDYIETKVLTVVKNEEINKADNEVVIEKLASMLLNLPASSRLATLHSIAAEYKLQVRQLDGIVGLFPKGQRTKAVALLMGHVVDHHFLWPWVQNTLRKGASVTRREMQFLQDEVGALYSFNPRCPCGHYKLRCNSYYDRIVLKRLQELSSSQASFRRRRKLKDISQTGDGELFRNCLKDGKKAVFNSVTPIDHNPESVTVYEFDFVSWERPDSELLALNDTEFDSLLKKVSDAKAVDEYACQEEKKVQQHAAEHPRPLGSTDCALQSKC